MEGLSTRTDLDYDTLWGALRDFLGRIGQVTDLDTVLVESLDALIDIFGADRGMILVRAADGTPYPIHARRWKTRLKPHEQVEISRTAVQRVLDSGELLAWDPALPEGTESIYAFGITGMLAGPLHTIPWRRYSSGSEEEPRQVRGVVYLDFRGLQKLLGPLHEELFRASTELLSLVLDHSELHRTVLELQRDAEPESAEAGRGGAVPELEDLLGPASLAEIRRQLVPIVKTSTPILLLGESGTGKTLLAQAIARASHRPKPFVRANLGHADDRNTVTSELFGHVRGSYTGAMSDRVGKVERANGGTLFLDEILNLPPAVQPLLLDLLQDGTYEPLGWTGPAPKRANLRVIAATNSDLETAVRAGHFRADVYYRLAGAVVRLPPLRERREDIPLLAEQYVRGADRNRNWILAPSLLRVLTGPELQWEGNLRQLQHLLDRAMANALADAPRATRLKAAHIDLDELTSQPLPTAAAAPRVTASLRAGDLSVTWTRIQADRERLDVLERQMLEQALSRNDGVVAWAAEEVGMPRTGFASRLKTLGIERKRPKRRRETQ
jgi:transcriptional regulator with GAF, ATPase, and Fis domain